MLALIRHVNWSGKEATAVLGVLKDLVENHLQALLPYSVFIQVACNYRLATCSGLCFHSRLEVSCLQGLFDSIYELELHNVRTLFQILVAIYTRGNDQGDNSEVLLSISLSITVCIHVCVCFRGIS
jgi:hypothetical protein